MEPGSQAAAVSAVTAPSVVTRGTVGVGMGDGRRRKGRDGLG